jgi:hypothetical protein
MLREIKANKGLTSAGIDITRKEEQEMMPT